MEASWLGGGGEALLTGDRGRYTESSAPGGLTSVQEVIRLGGKVGGGGGGGGGEGVFISLYRLSSFFCG